ncbi:uncharacterized protein LOC132714827, partial [Ruditapes philippinarum]|uniref:uncharacterized protein LOC132714827 n=1 Tax=Ruditapes philippinarum TaxID=129788 RepID=UPI00295BBD6A
MTNFIDFCVILAHFTIIYGFDDAHLASKAKADQIERTRCGYNLMKLWTAEIAHSPFAAAPLISDVDGDGRLDIIAAPLSESKTVVEAENGKTLTESRWPTQKLDTSILASPLQFDIDGDGMLDILFVTFSGDILFYTPNGTAIKDKFMEIAPGYVKEDWYNQVVSVSGDDIKTYVKEASDSVKHDKSYLPVDAHVMATPVIADINNDNKLEELIIPVSYYFDDEDYRLSENFEHINNINETELGKYVVSGITIVNLREMKVLQTIFLDLTT